MDDILTILKSIEALCNAPHWTSDRRWKVAALATRGRRLLEQKGDDDGALRPVRAD